MKQTKLDVAVLNLPLLFDMLVFARTTKKVLPAVLLFACSYSSIAEPVRGSVTAFGSVAHSEAVSNSSITELDKQNALSIDFLGTLDYQRFQLLAETVVRNRAPNDDHTSVERLKLGYRFGDNTRLWLGKFHNPAEYWLYEYHRGYYLQPSVTRPFDSYSVYRGGITSKTLSGIRLDTQWMLDDETHQFDLVAAIADTPHITTTAPPIDPGDIFTDFDRDQLTATVRLSYTPNPFMSNSSVGISYSKGEAGLTEGDAEYAGTSIAEFFQTPDLVIDPAIVDGLIQAPEQIIQGTEIQIDYFSGYINLENDYGRLIYSDSTLDFDITFSSDSEAVLNNLLTAIALDTGSQLPDRLRFRYLHGDYHINDKWTAFARWEDARSDDVAPIFSSLFGSFSLEIGYRKNIVGLRFDPFENHAITLQYSDHETVDQGREDNLHLNWTFVLDWGF